MTRCPQSPGWRRFAFAMLLAVSVPVTAQEHEEFVDEMESHLDALEQQNESDDLEALPTMQAPAGSATGSEAEMARVVREMINGVSGAHNRYLERITEIGLERLLDPVRLEGDRGMVEGRRMIADASAAADIAKADSLRVFDDLPAAIRAASLGDRDKADMLLGAERSLPAARERIDQQFELEQAAYREMAAVLDVFAGTEWEYVDGQLRFADDASAATYNASLARLNAIVAEQTRTQSEQIEQARGKLDQLRD